MGSLLEDILYELLRPEKQTRKRHSRQTPLQKQHSGQLPYYAKQNFFSDSEQVFYDILNAKLDAQRYTIFPKVRLGDFIQVEYTKKYTGGWWQRIRSRHVDYIVWDLVHQKIVLAIELDGNSHNKTEAKEIDAFKNSVFENVGIPLYRVRVGSNFECEIGNILQNLKN